MQQWSPAALGDPPPATDDRLIREGFTHWRGLVRQACHGAWGICQPPLTATITASTRLILSLAGRNGFELPAGKQTRVIEVPPGGALIIDRRAWNRPLDAHAKEFLTIDLRPEYIRLYRRRTRSPGALPADHCRTLLLRAPSPALRAAADCAEALAAFPGAALDAAALVLALCAERELNLPLQEGDTRWQTLREWLDGMLHRAIGRDDAARVLGVHPVHVSRILRRHTGSGFAAWVCQERIKRAQDLLRSTDLPVAAIANRCGFSSAEWFASSFRKLTGCAPGRWRLAHAQQAESGGLVS